MGFQTTLMILNDSLHEIDADPEGWWKETRAQIMGHNGSQAPTNYGFGHSANGFQIVAMHHADVTSVIAVGGNHSSILSHQVSQPHHTVEAKKELLKKMANELGYNLVRKPKK